MRDRELLHRIRVSGTARQLALMLCAVYLIAPMGNQLLGLMHQLSHLLSKPAQVIDHDLVHEGAMGDAASFESHASQIHQHKFLHAVGKYLSDTDSNAPPVGEKSINPSPDKYFESAFNKQLFFPLVDADREPASALIRLTNGYGFEFYEPPRQGPCL